jgi:hypothetical protein
MSAKLSVQREWFLYLDGRGIEHEKDDDEEDCLKSESRNRDKDLANSLFVYREVF